MSDICIPSIQFQGNPPWVEIDEEKPLGSKFEVATHEVQVNIVVLCLFRPTPSTSGKSEVARETQIDQNNWHGQESKAVSMIDR
jgi:hypothetical protein